MDSSRFLIVGALGQVGSALSEKYPDAIKTDKDELDITDWKSVSSYDWSKVDVILNAAAFTNVDAAETEEGRVAAWKVNTQAVGYMAKIACEYNLTLVHISTEYVFDGTKELHDESEPYSPLGVYAQTKAAAEIAASVTPKHFIVRISWLIGEGKNFVKTMIGLADKNISPTVVSDQIGRLTFCDTVVDSIDNLLQKNAEYGIYNVSNDGEPASWADITRQIFKDLGREDLKVTDTTTKDYFSSKPGISPRPLNSIMDLKKIKNIGISLPNWREKLKEYIAKEKISK